MAPSPFLVLQARAEARALLYRNHELELEEAIAPLSAYALSSGIVDQIGAAAAMAIIQKAFEVTKQDSEADE